MSSIRPGVCITQNQPGTSLLRELMTEFFDKIKTPLPNRVIAHTLGDMHRQAPVSPGGHDLGEALIQLEMTGQISTSLYHEVNNKVVVGSICEMLTKFGSNLQNSIVGHKIDERTMVYIEHQCRTVISALNKELKNEGFLFDVKLQSVTNDNGNIKFNVNMSNYPNTPTAETISSNAVDPAWNIDKETEMYIEDEELESPRDNMIRSDAPWRAE